MPRRDGLARHRVGRKPVADREGVCKGVREGVRQGFQLILYIYIYIYKYIYIYLYNIKSLATGRPPYLFSRLFFPSLINSLFLN